MTQLTTLRTTATIKNRNTADSNDAVSVEVLLSTRADYRCMHCWPSTIEIHEFNAEQSLSN